MSLFYTQIQKCFKPGGLLLLLFLTGCSGIFPIAEHPAPAVTQASELAMAKRYLGIEVEKTAAADPVPVQVGEMTIEYPMYLEANSSAAIILSIQMTETSSAQIFTTSDRLLLPGNQPPMINATGKYQAFVQVAPRMRARLVSAGMDVLPLFSEALRPVEIEKLNQPTTWQWLLKSPTASGSHHLVLEIALEDDPNPSWWGLIEVRVVGPSPTPGPTPTPTPDGWQKIGENFVNNPMTWIAPLLTFILGALGLYFGYIRKPTNKKK